jgi:hypothetical protein
MYLFRKGRREAGKGILISSSVLFALTSICSAIILNWH